MSSLLEGCYAKLQRAAESIDSLDQEIIGFLQACRGQYEVVREFQNNGLEFTFIVKGNITVSPRYAVLAGEIIHQIRSSLDHFVTALVIRNDCAPSRSNTFPISSTEDDFESAIKRGNLKGVSNSAINLVRQQQPFLQPCPEDHFLVSLRNFNNQDKHSLLLIVAAAANFAGKVVLGTDEEIARKLGVKPCRKIVNFGDFKRKRISEKGEKVFTIELAAPDPTFKADGDVVVQLVFEKCGLVELGHVIKILRGMHSATQQLILSCETEFN